MTQLTALLPLPVGATGGVTPVVVPGTGGVPDTAYQAPYPPTTPTGVATFNGRTGAVALSGADVTAAQGFAAYNAVNPSGYQTAAQVAAALPVADGATLKAVSGVFSIKGVPLALVASGSATAGQALVWNGMTWAPATVNGAVQSVAGLTGAIATAALQGALGLGTGAYVAAPTTGTTAGTFAAGNDSRIAGALQASAAATVATTGAYADLTGKPTRVTINQGIAALTSGASVVTDASTGNVFTLTLGANATLATPTNLAAGATYLWIITQDGTGSRTLAYGSAFSWPGGTVPTLSTAAGAVDLLTAVYDGTKLRAVLNKSFA